MKKGNLKAAYSQKHGKQPSFSWNSNKLIDEILKDKEELEEDSFEQDMMDAIIGNASLTPLNDSAKENCAKGHEMEPIYTKELMKMSKKGDLPLKLLEASSVRVTKKCRERYSKTSVDRVFVMKIINTIRAYYFVN